MKRDGVKVIQFADGPARNEVWELPDRGWDDWAAVADKFLVHSIHGIAAGYASEPVKWLEINHWPHSGRLIVFPSQHGPSGDRNESVCFELVSEHLLTLFQRVRSEVPDADHEAAWTILSRRVWLRVSECLTEGAAARAFITARQSHPFRIAGYDYEPGEGLWWLTEDGRIRPDAIR